MYPLKGSGQGSSRQYQLQVASNKQMISEQYTVLSHASSSQLPS